MTLKRTRTLMAWLLAAFFIRSLIPVGFMPLLGHGHALQLTLCDGYAPVPTSMPMDPGMDMDMSHGSARNAPQTHQDHGTCLFGASPALGAPLANPALPHAVRVATAIRTPSAQVSHHQLPWRAQSARGPPV